MAALWSPFAASSTTWFPVHSLISWGIETFTIFWELNRSVPWTSNSARPSWPLLDAPKEYTADFAWVPDPKPIIFLTQWTFSYTKDSSIRILESDETCCGKRCKQSYRANTCKSVSSNSLHKLWWWQETRLTGDDHELHGLMQAITLGIC